MKVSVYPKENHRTSVPIQITIEDAEAKPLVIVEELGQIPLMKSDGDFISEFWVQRAGEYQVEVIQGSKPVWSETLNIKEQEFLSFWVEFGLFLSILFPVLYGVAKWIQRNNGQRINKTKKNAQA
jgi:hypothetical protein